VCALHDLIIERAETLFCLQQLAVADGCAVDVAAEGNDALTFGITKGLLYASEMAEGRCVALRKTAQLQQKIDVHRWVTVNMCQNDLEPLAVDQRIDRLIKATG